MESTVRLCDCHWVRAMHSVECRHTKGGRRKGCLVVLKKSDFFSTYVATGLTVLSAKACPPTEVIWMKFPLEFYCFYEWPRAPDQPLQKHWGVGCSICFSFAGELNGGDCGYRAIQFVFFIIRCCHVLLWGNTMRDTVPVAGRRTLIASPVATPRSKIMLVLTWHPTGWCW